MAKPLYVLAFEHFRDKNSDDKLKAFVAYGMFVEAEHKWAAAQPTWPTEAKSKSFHNTSVPVPGGTDHYVNGAEQMLVEFVNDVVELEKQRFLEAAIAAYKMEAAKGHHKWWHGVLEAFGGALLWSAFLIAGAFFARWMGVDVLGVFEKLRVP